LLKELDQVGLQAFNAVGLQVAKKHTCMIAIEGDPPNPIGSGTFVEVDNQLFVATAKHLFEGLQADKLIGIYWGEEDNRCGVTNSDIILDEKLDLAAIPMPADTKACGVSLGCHHCDYSDSETDLFVVSGVPSEKCKIDQHTKTIVVGHFSLGLVSLPRQSWPTNPEVPIFPDVHMFFNYTRDLAINGNGERMNQINPHGLSGGGIWSVPILSQGSVWSPANSTLVAIQSSVESDKWRYLRATRIEHWLRLVSNS